MYIFVRFSPRFWHFYQNSVTKQLFNAICVLLRGGGKFASRGAARPNVSPLLHTPRTGVLANTPCPLQLHIDRPDTRRLVKIARYVYFNRAGVYAQTPASYVALLCLCSVRVLNYL